MAYRSKLVWLGRAPNVFADPEPAFPPPGLPAEPAPPPPDAIIDFDRESPLVKVGPGALELTALVLPPGIGQGTPPARLRLLAYDVEIPDGTSGEGLAAYQHVAQGESLVTQWGLCPVRVGGLPQSPGYTFALFADFPLA